jgi:hypothetical protein
MSLGTSQHSAGGAINFTARFLDLTNGSQLKLLSSVWAEQMLLTLF